jgi:type IV pilus assembly protein PilN
MPRINLLPWREAERKERQKNFGIASLLALVVGLIVIWGVNTYLQGMIDYQNSRNQRLQQEIATLDEQIKEIRNLRLKKERLLLRMAAIEDLQRTRPEVVHLFDELVKAVPQGIYLTEFSQSGKNLLMKGMAESSTRVSAFMRNIDESQWLASPQLRVVQSGGSGARGGTTRVTVGRGAEFTLAAQQVGMGEPEGEE